MPALYSPAIKAARMTVVRDAINGGTLNLHNPLGTVMASVPLSATSGTVAADTLTLAAFPKTATATVASSYPAPVASASLRSSTLVDVLTGLTVGLSLTACPLWTANTILAVGDVRTNGANQYRVTAQSGATASFSGPTGTASSIIDGGVTWAYIAPANAAVQLDSMIWNVGDTLTFAVNPRFVHAA